MGAYVTKSSIKEICNKLASLGFEPFELDLMGLVYRKNGQSVKIRPCMNDTGRAEARNYRILSSDTEYETILTESLPKDDTYKEPSLECQAVTPCVD